MGRLVRKGRTTVRSYKSHVGHRREVLITEGDSGGEPEGVGRDPWRRRVSARSTLQGVGNFLSRSCLTKKVSSVPRTSVRVYWSESKTEVSRCLGCLTK